MKIHLQRSFFPEIKKDFVSYGAFVIKAFRYSSGVEALEIENKQCSFIFTPFKGQQIWHFKVNGEDLSMQTSVKEPQSSSVYLENYGGFLYHCGIISFGAPDATHPQHGEIPNAQYDSAYICCEDDENGKYICLGGELNHDTAFVRKYKFCPEIKIYENSSLFKIKVTLKNMRAYPMEYMYLCHINFKPKDGAKLLCSAKQDAEHIKIYKTSGSKELCEYFDKLEKDITIMNDVGAKGQCYDPEICFGIKYESDENGKAYTLQYTDDGACFVSHPTDVLSSAVRWISRTSNEDSMGMVLPATSEHLGYEYAKTNNQLKVLEANASLEFHIEAGYIDKSYAEKIKEKIYSVIRQ